MKKVIEVKADYLKELNWLIKRRLGNGVYATSINLSVALPRLVDRKGKRTIYFDKYEDIGRIQIKYKDGKHTLILPKIKDLQKAVKEVD